MRNQDVFSTRRRGGPWVWVLCVLLTAAGLVYQRMTGPTYPISAYRQWEDEQGHAHIILGKLLRTQVRPDPAKLDLIVKGFDPYPRGEVVWRKYPTSDPWKVEPMTNSTLHYRYTFPVLPTAGKLEYVVRIVAKDQTITLPEDGSAILRYRDDVPAFILVPHIIAMFGGLLFGLRLILGALRDEDNLGRFFPWLMAFIVPGGLILGPLVQKYAFGAYWTGWPVGEDLTDTKTLVAVVAWLAAWWAIPRLGRAGRWAVLAAGIVMLAVYMIPHSARGSQVDWSKEPTSAGSKP